MWLISSVGTVANSARAKNQDGRGRRMNSISASSTSPLFSQHKLKHNSSSISVPYLYPSKLRLKSPSLISGFPKLSVKCSSSSNQPQEPDSKDVLDAFFLGKALAEAINERIESTVGEVLSVVGRLQAEQQKQVQEFQEDVLERAKKAKERAAREAMEAQSLIPKSTTTVVSTTTDATSSVVSQSTTTYVAPPASSNGPNTKKGPNINDPLLGMLTDD